MIIVEAIVDAFYATRRVIDALGRVDGLDESWMTC